ncbi:hypothetical protein HPULCUR_009524 [Helicostylum pulchrum]|uniref:Uncharacterized protein n=1 Tax=Helicostylum pulchrum TaxID=562976 RepID=A0ABP9YBS8_9FUNG
MVQNTAHEFELASLRVLREAFKDVSTIPQVEGSTHRTEVVSEASHSTGITALSNEYIVFDIPGWSGEQKFCEATFVRKLEGILDILFKNTKIFAKDGESSSQAAKSNQIANEDGAQYGRTLDIQ